MKSKTCGNPMCKNPLPPDTHQNKHYCDRKCRDEAYFIRKKEASRKARREAFEDFHKHHPEYYEKIKEVAIDCIKWWGHYSTRDVIGYCKVRHNWKVASNHYTFYHHKLERDLEGVCANSPSPRLYAEL